MKTALELCEILRTRGMKITPQRRAIFEALETQGGHITADGLHHLVQQRMPDVSLATVYKTLGELVGMGEVSEVHVGTGPNRYDVNLDTHDHLLCMGCGEINDVYPTHAENVGLPGGTGYTVVDRHITFRGYCPACRKLKES